VHEKVSTLDNREIQKYMAYLHTMKYSAIKMHEVPLPATIWVKLDHIMLSGRSQTQKPHTMVLFM
jgi:hypothetical protein